MYKPCIFKAHRKFAHGFTLIELMIAVAIVAILSAIAVPSYRSYILKAQRTDGKEALLRVQSRQENWRNNNVSYTSSLSNLNLSNKSAEGYYTIAITSSSSTGYVATATRTGDGSCNTLTLTVAATGETKTPTDCW